MSSINLLQHQMNKFGVVTVMDVLLSDISTGKPILFLDTLKMTSITQEGESKDIRGGIGAPELISYDFARTVSLEIQDALASMSSLQLLWGGKALAGDTKYTAMFEAVVEADGKIPLPKDLKIDTAALTGDGDEAEKAVVLGVENAALYPAVVTGQAIVASTAPLGSTVKVFIPATLTLDDQKGLLAVAINSIDIPPTVKMVGQTFFIDQATGKKIPMQVEVPKLKINTGASMTMEAEGDAAVFDFNAKALVDENKNFFILRQLGKPGDEPDQAVPTSVEP